MIRPLSNNVLIKRQDSDKRSVGGIIIPETAMEKSQRGEVLAIGPGRTSEQGNYLPMEVRPGNIVLFEKHGGREITYEGEKYLLVSENNIIAVIEALEGN